MSLTRKLIILLLALAGIAPARADMSLSFAAPESFDARPWCFWYWMHGAVTRQGITADLEAMAANGLGGTYLMPIRSVDQKPELGGTVRQLSPEWYAMVDWAMQEADRLGLKLGMHICDGFALAGGPWITPEESMQKVVMTDVNDTIGTTIGYYSVPTRYLKGERFFEPVPSTKPQPVADASVDPTWANALRVKVEGRGDDLKIDTVGGGFQAKKPCRVDYTFSRAITASALELVLPSTQFQAQRLDVWASTDGVNYRHVKQLVPARTGWQNYDYNTTHSITTTTARYWRFCWTPEGTEPGSEDLDQAKWSPSLKVKQILFHAAPRINQWEGKAGLVWRISSTRQNTLEPTDYIPRHQVRRLADRYNIDPSDYRNTYFRLASVSTGHDNATAGDGKGLECDKFSRQAVRKQLDGWFNSHFTAAVPGVDAGQHQALAQRVLKYMHVDSWECGSQNWSPTFAAEFQKRRGYDIEDYLPLMVGIPIEDEATSERILRDVRVTINELIDDVFYDELRSNALRMDCRLSAESVCPTMVSDGMEHYRYADLPMGEFWLRSPTHDKINDMLDAISGGHIYGKRIIQAEGFTQLRGVFDEDPAMLKPVLDRNFCLGINRLFYHVYCLNPDPTQRPGMTLDGIGLFFQRGNTWFDEGADFTRYVTRCQYLLQQGRPVVDIAVYTGQEMPRRAFQPDRLVPMLPGLFGEARVKSEAERLANVGVPVIERPAGVKHNANVLTPEQWINPLHGYQYDSFNEDALLRCRVDGTAITMQSNDDAAPMYRLLVLPTRHQMDPDGLPLSAEAQRKIDELRGKGVKVLTREQLPWTPHTLDSLGIAPDVSNLPEGIGYCHRTSYQAEVYFLANQTDSLVVLHPTFRDHMGRQAELWDPLTGQIRAARYTSSPLPDATVTATPEVILQPHGSVFVVFPQAATLDGQLAPALQHEANPVTLQRLDTLHWSIAFHDTQATMECDTLPDWSHSLQPEVRYYSGRATYTASFVADTLVQQSRAGGSDRLYLCLGRIANLATVRVNGHDCGIAWTAPYEVDVTDALCEGENRLELIVTNTWSNAIQGHDEGHDPFPGIWTNARYRKATKDLLPAGLLGPVELISK